jgi:membrane dipeptidase
MPAELADAGRLQHLAQALRRRGFDETDVRRLAYDNWRDLLARTWR